MSIRAQQNQRISHSWKSSAAMASVKSRSKPGAKKLAQLFNFIVEAIFQLFLRPEIMRDVGPDHPPERLHDWKDEVKAMGPQIF